MRWTEVINIQDFSDVQQRALEDREEKREMVGWLVGWKTGCMRKKKGIACMELGRGWLLNLDAAWKI